MIWLICLAIGLFWFWVAWILGWSVGWMIGAGVATFLAAFVGLAIFMVGSMDSRWEPQS